MKPVKLGMNKSFITLGPDSVPARHFWKSLFKKKTADAN